MIFLFNQSFSYAKGLPEFGKTYLISSVFNNKCIEVKDPNLGDRAEVHFWKCDHGENQQVILSPTTTMGLVQIQFVHSSKCLDIEKGKIENGGKLIQFACTNGNNQQFHVRGHKGASWFTIESEKGDYCLDAKDFGRDGGTSLHLWKCTKAANQRFFIDSLPSNNSSKSLPLLLTFQNNPEEAHTKNLVSTLEKWNWPHKVIGNGMKWHGFGTKLAENLRNLKELMNDDPDRVAVLSDAADVLTNSSPEQFLKDYLRISQYDGHNRIVFSAEKACCVSPMNYPGNTPGNFISNADGTRLNLAVEDKKRETDRSVAETWKSEMIKIAKKEGYNEHGLDYLYLNAGMIAGRIKDLKEMLEYVKSGENEDDQALFSEYFLRFPNKVQLDYQNILFSNASGWAGWSTLKGCFFEWNSDFEQFFQSETKTFPALIQTPGKYWACYDHLMKLIGGSQR